MKKIKKLYDSNPFDHKTGDIILTSSTGLCANINKLIQKTFYRAKWNSKITHAFICYDKGIFIEATLNKSLSSFSFQSDCRNSNQVEYKVLRNKNLKDNIIKQENLKKEMKFHLQKNYKKSLLLKILLRIPGKKNEMFCSEFVTKVFKNIGIDIIKTLSKLDNQLNKIMPIHLEELLKNKDWEEIKYSNFNKNDIIMQMQANSLQDSALNMISQNDKAISTSEKNLKELAGDKYNPPKSNSEYWFQK